MKRLLTVFGIIAIIAAISMVFPKTAFTDTQKDTTEISQPAPVTIDGGQNEITAATGGLKKFFEYTGFANVTSGHLIMLVVGLIFIFLAIRYDYEPLLLIPIGVGILIGNIPFMLNAGLQLGIYESGSVMNYLYFGVTAGIYPPIIFLGIGAMTDFSSLISNPKLMLLGAAA